MVVVFDADFLSLLLNHEATPPVDLTTRTPVEQASQRIEALVHAPDSDLSWAYVAGVGAIQRN